MMQSPLMPLKESRRVSLPTSLMSPRLYPVGCRLSPTISPTRLSPVKSPTRRSLPTPPTPPTPRRSLPGTPRSSSPRATSPRLPSRKPLADVDEHFPASSSSSSSEHTPHHRRRWGYRYPKYQQSLRDSSSHMEDSFPSSQAGSTESKEGQLRSFAYKYGSVFDNGYEMKDKPVKADRDNRRATCPEICLFPPNNRPSRRVVLRVYGAKNSGKKTLLHQLHRHASNTTDEVMIEDDDGTGRRSSFLLNGEEIRLELLIESALEMEPFSCHLPVYVILYSVDSRESFHYAQQLLSRISQTHTDKPARAILVGNKMDLKRNQVVTTIEGKCMSKIYKSSFVEASALLGMNLDTLWAELIKQLEHPGETTWMERVVNKGKVFAKSCEEIVLKMIAA